MKFFRRRPDDATDESAAVEDSAALERVVIFQADGIVEGWIRPQEQRLSDALNAGKPLDVQVPSPDGTPGPWTDFNLDGVMAVAAPPQPSPRAMSRRRHAVELFAEPYLFGGIAHMPPGADPIRYAKSTPLRWLPLTRCTVRTEDQEWEVEVVIVNLDHVSRLG
jgi:hypothetical protein